MTAEGAAPAASNGSTPLFKVGGEGLLQPLSLVFTRHGVTDMTLTHALSGSGVPGPPLNSQGRVQAAKAADAIYGIGRRTWPKLTTVTRVLASPMVRTQDTAGSVGRRIGAHVETMDGLREIDFGAWEGLTGEQVAERDGDALNRWRRGDFTPEGGESFDVLGERLEGVLRDLAGQHAEFAASGRDEERAWACVSHAMAIKAAVGVSMGMSQRAWGSMWPQPASLTILQLRVTPAGDIAERHLMCMGALTD